MELFRYAILERFSSSVRRMGRWNQKYKQLLVIQRKRAGKAKQNAAIASTHSSRYWFVGLWRCSSYLPFNLVSHLLLQLESEDASLQHQASTLKNLLLQHWQLTITCSPSPAFDLTAFFQYCSNKRQSTHQRSSCSAPRHSTIAPPDHSSLNHCIQHDQP